MAQHAGELSVGVQSLGQPFGDEHLAAGQGEGVDRLRVVQQAELEAVASPSGGAPSTTRCPTRVTRACASLSGSSPPYWCSISGAACRPSATSCSGVMLPTCCFSWVMGLSTLLPK